MAYLYFYFFREPKNENVKISLYFGFLTNNETFFEKHL